MVLGLDIGSTTSRVVTSFWKDRSSHFDCFQVQRNIAHMFIPERLLFPLNNTLPAYTWAPTKGRNTAGFLESRGEEGSVWDA